MRKLLFALLLLAAPALADTHYVGPANCSNSGTGTSYATPWCTLAYAVGNANFTAGDVVIVKDGTYNVNCGDSTNGYAVTFGSAGTAGAYKTIRAENRRMAILDAGYNCHSHLLFLGGANYWKIEGLVLTKAYWSPLWANATVHHLEFRDLDLDFVGDQRTDPTPACTGIYTSDTVSDITFDRCDFHTIGRQGAYASNKDHAIYAGGANWVITNNIFYSNVSGWDIQTHGNASNWLIAHNVFKGPNAVGKRGRILIWDGDVASTQGGFTIQNNIFYDPNTNSVALCSADFPAASVNNWDHNLSFGDTQGYTSFWVDATYDGCSASTNTNRITAANNTVGNPQFVPSTDFHIPTTSPAKDAGVAIPSITFDKDGNPRPQNGVYDIGAHEFVVQGGGGGAISYLGSVVQTSSSQTPSFSVTVPAGTTLVTVGIAFYLGSWDLAVNSMTLGGQGHVFINRSADQGTIYALRVHYFLNVPTGAQTFTASYADPLTYGAAYTFMFWSGTATVDPIRGSAYVNQTGTGEGYITKITPAFASSTTDTVVAYASSMTSANTPDLDVGGQTSTVEGNNFNGVGYGAGYKQGTGATDTASGTIYDGAVVGFSIKVGAAPPLTKRKFILIFP